MRSLICATLIVGIFTPAMEAGAFKKQTPATLTLINDCDEAAEFSIVRSSGDGRWTEVLEPQESWTQEIPIPLTIGDRDQRKLVLVTKVGVGFPEELSLAPGESLIYLVDCEGVLTEIPAGSASTAPLREFGVLASAMTGLCCLGFIGAFFGRAPRSDDDEHTSPADEHDAE